MHGAFLLQQFAQALPWARAELCTSLGRRLHRSVSVLALALQLSIHQTISS
jgi:hypothetical protein